MDRRTFVGAMAGVAALPAGVRAASPQDDALIRQRVQDIYKAFSTGDVARYRSYMAEDYLLLENGEISDLERDISFISERPDGFQRTDSFDFQHVGIAGEMAYAVYYVNSLASDPQTPPKSLRWLESIAFRRVDGQWRCALIHSTVIRAPQVEAIGLEKG